MMDAVRRACLEFGRKEASEQRKGIQAWTTSDTVRLVSLHAAMPPNTRGSTRPSQSQNLAKAPVQHSRRPAAVAVAHDNGHEHDNVSSAQPDADEEPMELFLDLMLGTPILFYVEKDVSNREQIVKLIRVFHASIVPPALSLTTTRSTVALFLHPTPPSTIFWVRNHLKRPMLALALALARRPGRIAESR